MEGLKRQKSKSLTNNKNIALENENKNCLKKG